MKYRLSYTNRFDREMRRVMSFGSEQDLKCAVERIEKANGGNKVKVDVVFTGSEEAFLDRIAEYAKELKVTHFTKEALFTIAEVLLASDRKILNAYRKLDEAEKNDFDSMMAQRVYNKLSLV